MPKIIENIRAQLLAEAKKQIAENGYGKTTVRSVAAACGVGVGTVYNYFKSKEMLIASFMAEDWRMCIEEMKSVSSASPAQVLQKMVETLNAFIIRHRALFSDKDASKVFAAALSERHKMLREQLAEIILPICADSSVEDRKFLADHIAESLLSWTIAGKTFQEQYAVLSLLFK